MSTIYFAQHVERNGQKSFALTQDPTIEQGGDDSIRAIYSLGPLSEQEQAMLDVFLGIDAATDTNVAGDLLAKVFATGHNAM